MALPLKPPLPPMEARSVDQIPAGDGWQYEPKWDGFRCLAFRDGADIHFAPGGPSRWSTERTGEWEPVDPKIVVEESAIGFSEVPFGACRPIETSVEVLFMNPKQATSLLGR